MQRKDINGEVRISVSTFFDLLEEDEKVQQEAEFLQNQYRDAISMMGEFLQFLKTKQYFEDIKQEFNASHNRLSLGVNSENGRVNMYIDGKKVQSKD